MNDPDRHKPDQEDLDRARRIMESIVTGYSPESGDDALLYYLDVYKKNTSLREHASPSEATWNKISANLDTPDRPGRSNWLSISPTFWKIAAIFLAAAGLGLAYIIFQTSEPKQLAKSDAERSVIELADGSTVTLRPYSSLYELEITDTRHTYRVEGEAYFDVAEDQNRQFTAVSGDAKVMVTGTEFNLSNWGEAVRVYLETGRVTFSNLDESMVVTLQPGEYSEKIGNVITEPATAAEQSFTGWLTNELSLNSRIFSDVAVEIEHHFNLRLEIPDSMADEQLSGSLQLQTPNQVLSDLALSLNGRFVRVNENLYRFEPLP